MKFGHIFTILALCCFGLAPFSGCGPETKTVDSDKGGHHDHDHGDHDHDHGDHGHGDHDHGELPAHGPNKGHLFKLDGTDMVGEWIHYNDNDIIRVLLLDEKLENAVALDGVTITPTAGSDRTPFALELDTEQNGSKENPMQLVYMLDDKALGIAMSLGVEVEFSVGGNKYKGAIAPHAPHDH